MLVRYFTLNDIFLGPIEIIYGFLLWLLHFVVKNVMVIGLWCALTKLLSASFNICRWLRPFTWCLSRFFIISVNHCPILVNCFYKLFWQIWNCTVSRFCVIRTKLLVFFSWFFKVSKKVIADKFYQICLGNSKQWHFFTQGRYSAGVCSCNIYLQCSTCSCELRPIWQLRLPIQLSRTAQRISSNR